MKLSEQIWRDFIKEDPRPESIHQVSYGYLVDLILAIRNLEHEKDENGLILQ